MNTIARITAFILITAGILVMLSGIALGVTGAIRSLMTIVTAARPLRTAANPGLLVLLFILVQGLMVTAAGEGLFLLANIARK